MGSVNSSINKDMYLLQKLEQFYSYLHLSTTTSWGIIFLQSQKEMKKNYGNVGYFKQFLSR